jgi:hypothetical protein
MPVYSVSLEELIGSERAAVLRAVAGEAAEPITEVQLRNPSPRLLPSHGDLQRLVAETVGNLEPNLFVETLSLYTKPSGRNPAAAWNNTEQTALFNQLTALSTLAGIEYYSASRKTMRTFYESSLVIDSPAGKRPLPDPVFSVLPAEFSLYARQKDLTFGDNIYRFDYRTSADALFFVQENITSLSVGIIRAVGRNRLRTLIAVIDTDDSLVIYTVAMAKTASLPGMGERISASFTNRIEAILAWFTERANLVFG